MKKIENKEEEKKLENIYIHTQVIMLRQEEK